jgi:selenocysteine lyase/cysteine desulfurase
LHPRLTRVNLRLSVHLFNRPAEIDQALAVLHADGGR